MVRASNLPLVVGVGDGPFGLMEEWDDRLPERRFDNLQFVDFSRIYPLREERVRDAAFAIAALQEIPEQYREVQRLRLLAAR